MKHATNYVENQDDRENKVLESFSNFILKIGT